jgi:hypothetical protein
MPNIYISHHRIRVELVSLAVCFLIATGLNIYAIIHYGSPLSELWTSILYVLEATAVLYAVWVVVRLLCYGVARLFGYRPKSQSHRQRHHHYRY